MARIKELVLWSEEVMDEVYPHLSEKDREFIVEHQNEIDEVFTEFFVAGYTPEEGAKEVLATLRDLQYDHHWARSA